MYLGQARRPGALQRSLSTSSPDGNEAFRPITQQIRPEGPIHTYLSGDASPREQMVPSLEHRVAHGAGKMEPEQGGAGGLGERKRGQGPPEASLESARSTKTCYFLSVAPPWCQCLSARPSSSPQTSWKAYVIWGLQTPGIWDSGALRGWQFCFDLPPVPLAQTRLHNPYSKAKAAI